MIKKTLEYNIGGPCCWYCPTDLEVNHYQPVAFIEVLKSPFDTIIPGASFLTSKTGGLYGKTSVTERDDNVFSTRIWELPAWAIDIAMAFQSCKLCGKWAAKDWKANSASIFTKVMDYFCPGSNAASVFAMDKLNEAIPDCFPKLLYDSAIDPQWRFACRDLGLGALSLAACMPGVRHTGVDQKAAEFFELDDPPCIGSSTYNWGPTYPRQMRVFNGDARMAAAVTAIRAVSVASDLGLFDFRKEFTRSKLQLVYPSKTFGSIIGTNEARSSMREADIEPGNGNYGYVWWTHVSCCKSMSQIFGACAPVPPCSPG